MKIQIDPEFQALLYPSSDVERNILEESLLEEGCRDALVTWRGLIIDGHNRYEICTQHGIKFDIVERDLPGRDAAKDWIDKNQLGRRNLTPDAFKLALGRRYNRSKKAVGRPKHEDGKSVQNEHLKTESKLAQEHAVSPSTVRRAGKFAEEVEADPSLLEAIQSRTPIKKAHVSHASGNNEWYTPPWLIDAARKTMNGIDCDPASSRAANKAVGADKFYTRSDNGLDQEWPGRVWMNPPYSQPEINQFSAAIVEKFGAEEVTEACVLVNNATETAWCQNMLRVASAVCFLSGRVKFLNREGDAIGTPLQGQIIIYMGDNVDSFYANFSNVGIVLRP